MNETNQLRKALWGGYRREDVQEYMDSLYEEAEQKYNDLAEEQERLVQENQLLRQWLNKAEGKEAGESTLTDFNSEAAFDLPEGVYQFDAESHTVVDLNVAVGQTAPLEVEQPKLTVLPTKKAKPEIKAEVKEEVKAEVKAEAEAEAAAKAEVKAEVKQEVKQESKGKGIEVNAQKQTEGHSPVQQTSSRPVKHYYVQRPKPKVETVVSVQAEVPIDTPIHSNLTTPNVTQPSRQAESQPVQHNLYGEVGQQTAAYSYGGQVPYAAPYAIPGQTFYGQPAYAYPGMPYTPQMQQMPPMQMMPSAQDPTLLARLEKLEADLAQTKAQLDFANKLLKDLYQ